MTANNRTYLHAGALSPYPFTDVDGLPFPYSCIYAIGVCAVPKYGTGTRVAVTGVELSKDAVSISLSWISQSGDGSLMCTLSASNWGGYGSSYVENEHMAWLCAGSVPPAAYGSYTGNWALDPACVTFSEPEVGNAFTSAETAELSADGLLGLYMLPAGVGISGLGLAGARFAIAYVGGADTTGTVSRTSEAAGYSAVTSVNGMEAQDNGVLWLSTSAPEDEPPEAAARYVTFTVDRSLLYGHRPSLASEMSRNGDTAAEMAGAMEDIGGAVVVTVDGHRALPNCYGEQDEAME